MRRAAAWVFVFAATEEKMINELLLVFVMAVLYGMVLVAYRFAGLSGLMCYNVFIVIVANIEVLMLVDAFGMEMTLGNVLFATTFLVTDIISETSGKKAARQAVLTGMGASLLFIVISETWMRYMPSANDWAAPAMRELFAHTPRLMAASFIVYVISQYFDIWLYHKFWALTTARTGDARRLLWVRNASTLASQFVNTALYTLLAFGGMYDWPTLRSILISTYAIYVVLSFCDTPVIYLARRMNRENKSIAQPPKF
ncbi:MAG: queuosine precursor transporter [Gracilibacteraceae bacterium]|jgi:uncharacterized integral membrane protein (TIGR00697 family)|nr:queuosine precursor transporter [Gracilibacteraceae bacterium]